MTVFPSLCYGTRRFLGVRKLSEFKITGLFLRYIVEEKKCQMTVSDITKKLYSLLFTFTPIKNDCLPEIHVGVDKVLTKVFVFKSFLEIKTGNKNKKRCAL